MKNTPFAPKEAWIAGGLVGAAIKNGQITLQAACSRHIAESHVSAHPYLLDDLTTAQCWVKGIINSSGNILVRLADGGFAPVGKETGKSRLCHGVSIFASANELSRDPSPDYVKSKADAEKLCLLSQVISAKGWTVAEIAAASGIDCARLRVLAAQNLLRAVLGEISRLENSLQMPKLSANTIRMITG